MTNKIKHAIMTIIAVMTLAATAAAQPVNILTAENFVDITKSAEVQEISYGYGETFECTFYGGGGITALGNEVYEGCIAVDPAVIPLGSTVYVEFPPGYEYLSGSYYACDVGSAVYGNVIDVYLDASDWELNQLGRIMVTVYR